MHSLYLDSFCGTLYASVSSSLTLTHYAQVIKSSYEEVLKHLTSSMTVTLVVSDMLPEGYDDPK